MLLTRKPRNEGGASAVEAALVAPLFFAFVFAIVEFGVFLFNANSVTNASRAGAREASTWAASPLSDFNILKAANRSLGSLATGLDAVIVFKGTGANAVVPIDCVDAIPTSSRGIAGVCNIYRSDDLKALDEANFGWSDLNTPLENAGKWDTTWPATKRIEEVTGTVSPDWVGVYVQANHRSLSGVVPSKKIRKTSVAQIEPQRAG
jgi:TadE-like protein